MTANDDKYFKRKIKEVFPPGYHEEIQRKEEAARQRALAAYLEKRDDKPDKFHKDVVSISAELSKLLIKKHKDYGPLNISRSPGGPLNGLRVRIWDKVARINNLLDSGSTPENESLRDSFLDLANYSIIALMVLDQTWPELPKDN